MARGRTQEGWEEGKLHCAATSKAWVATPMYLPGVHLLEESVQVVRSVKDVAQRTDCVRKQIRRCNQGDDTTHGFDLLYIEKPWKGTIPEGKGKIRLPPLAKEVEDTAAMFGSQLTTGWVHHFIFGYSNISWEKWKTDRRTEGQRETKRWKDSYTERRSS